MRGFFAMLSRMKHISRWGLMRCSRSETLSEHTLETAMLTHALIEIGNKRFGHSLDAGKGVILALYHDCTEIITGDLPTPVKYHDPSIQDSYKAIERQAAERLLAMLPNDLAESFSPYLGDDALKEYRPYVKAADKLSALIKCVEELQSGNREFERAKESIMNHPALALPEAVVFVKEFLPAFALTLDEVEHFGAN